FFFSSGRRHTRCYRDWSSDVCSSDLTATSALATLSLPLSPFEAWQFLYFGCTNCPEASATADPDGDGLDNQSEFTAGTSPTNSEIGRASCRERGERSGATVDGKQGTD